MQWLWAALTLSVAYIAVLQSRSYFLSNALYRNDIIFSVNPLFSLFFLTNPPKSIRTKHFPTTLNLPVGSLPPFRGIYHNKGLWLSPLNPSYCNRLYSLSAGRHIFQSHVSVSAPPYCAVDFRHSPIQTIQMSGGLVRRTSKQIFNHDLFSRYLSIHTFLYLFIY